MEQILLIIHVITSITIIVLILLQQGKGAEVGASFGSGASQTVFGSQGSGSFLTRLTAILVTVFFITSLALAYIATHRARPSSIDELLEKVQVDSTAAPASNASKTSPNANAPSVPNASKSETAAPQSETSGDIPKLKN